MSENAKLFIWMIFILWDMWIILKHEWNKYGKRGRKTKKETEDVRSNTEG